MKMKTRPRNREKLLYMEVVTTFVCVARKYVSCHLAFFFLHYLGSTFLFSFSCLSFKSIKVLLIFFITCFKSMEVNEMRYDIY